jgi:AcrR family transcriptional regulator
MAVRNRTLAPARTVLEVATDVLVANPAASLSDIATAAGIGRTTLHKLYPTRHELLVALARDALDLLEEIYRGIDLDVPAERAADAVRELVTALVPLGSRLAFLLRQPSLDTETELTGRLRELDRPVRALVQRARAHGAFRAELPDEWVLATINALVYAAWEQVAAGQIARAAAPELVMSTLLGGVRGGAGPGI